MNRGKTGEIPALQIWPPNPNWGVRVAFCGSARLLLPTRGARRSLRHRTQKAGRRKRMEGSRLVLRITLAHTMCCLAACDCPSRGVRARPYSHTARTTWKENHPGLEVLGAILVTSERDEWVWETPIKASAK